MILCQFQLLIPKIALKKFGYIFTQKGFFMNKGFSPSEHPEKQIKDIGAAIKRKTKELKNVLRNPVVVAAHLDKPANDDL